MSALQLVPTKRRRFLRGWPLFVLTLVGLFVFIWVDHRVKAGAPAQGFHPPDATYIVTALDFGRCWESALLSNAVRSARDEWPNAGSKIELRIRQDTGIRPTPRRWRLWMGYRLLAASAPEGIGVSTYPGLLLRMASAIHQRVSSPVSGDDVWQYSTVYYGWRDGFLVASRSSAYVAAALDTSPAMFADDLPVYAVGLASREDPKFDIQITAIEPFDIQGQIESEVTPRTAPITLPNAWNDPPMAAISATHWKDIETVLLDANGALRPLPAYAWLQEFLATVFNHWELAAPPSKWDDDQLDHCGLAVCGVDLLDTLPIPEIGFVVRSNVHVLGPHPLSGMLGEGADSIAFEWDGYPGLMYPLLGSAWAPCLGQTSRDWIFATRESLMRRLATELKDGSPLEADMALHLDWGQASDALTSLLGRTESWELFREKSQDEVRNEIGPIVRAIGQLGRLELVFKQVDGRTELRGLLARPLPRDPS